MHIEPYCYRPRLDVGNNWKRVGRNSKACICVPRAMKTTTKQQNAEIPGYPTVHVSKLKWCLTRVHVILWINITFSTITNSFRINGFFTWSIHEKKVLRQHKLRHLLQLSGPVGESGLCIPHFTTKHSRIANVISNAVFDRKTPVIDSTKRFDNKFPRNGRVCFTVGSKSFEGTDGEFHAAGFI